MNIIMNAEGASFGNELQEFKDSTKSMPAPHRGHMLDINDFIRAIHNSVARYVLSPVKTGLLLSLAFFNNEKNY